MDYGIIIRYAFVAIQRRESNNKELKSYNSGIKKNFLKH